MKIMYAIMKKIGVIFIENALASLSIKIGE